MVKNRIIALALTIMLLSSSTFVIAETSDEREEAINEAKQILDVKDVIASILLVEDLRIQKN